MHRGPAANAGRSSRSRVVRQRDRCREAAPREHLTMPPFVLPSYPRQGKVRARTMVRQNDLFGAAARFRWVVLTACALLLPGAGADAQVFFSRETGLLSATFDGTPLREVLAEVSRKTGIAITIDPAVDKKVFIEMRRRPVDEVLMEIVSPLNSMFIYKGDAVREVKIYANSPSDSSEKIVPSLSSPASPVMGASGEPSAGVAVSGGAPSGGAPSGGVPSGGVPAGGGDDASSSADVTATPPQSGSYESLPPKRPPRPRGPEQRRLPESDGSTVQ